MRDRRLGAVGLLAAGLLAVGLLAVGLAADAPTHRAVDSPPAAVAHRGHSAVAPENTVAAVRDAVDAGADAVEIDVRVTADGVPVAMHDHTVDRTTDGSGPITGLTAAEVAELDAGSWFGPDYTGEPVPTLDAVLRALRTPKATDEVELVLEIKGPQPPGAVAAMIDVVIGAGFEDRVLVQSFDEQVLADAGALAPDLPLGLLRRALDPDPVAAAQRFGAMAYNPAADALLERPEVVRELRDAGVSVLPYTVDDRDRWRALTRLGVDGIITNRVGDYRAWIDAGAR